MEWLLLSLLSATTLASADAATKYYLAAYGSWELTAVRNILPPLLFLPWLCLQPWPALPPTFWYWSAISVPLEIIAMWFYMQAIRLAPLASILPYLGFTPVFSSVIGFVILGESISRLGLLGVMLVSTGTYLLNLDRAFRGRRYALLRPLHAVFTEPGPRHMLAAALIYSLTSVFSKAAMQQMPPLFFGMLYFALIGIANLILLLVTKPAILTVLWRKPAKNMLIASLMSIMNTAHFLALPQVQVAYMIAVKRTSMLFGVLYGGLLFKETGWKRNLLAGGIIVAGVFLIAI